MAANPTATPKIAVPYLPLKTFLSTLDGLASFWPDQIDKSLWSSQSGGMQGQLISTYKFFGLIDNSGTPSPELKKLADDKANRPQLLRELMKRSYGELMKLDLSKATPASFDAELRKLGQEGDTHRKAASFFLAAAKFANIPLSPLLTKRGSMVTMRPKRTNRIIRRDPQGQHTPPPPPPPPGGHPALAARPFTLPGGTQITIGTSVDALHMPSEDRKIVFDLLEQLEGYGIDPDENLGSDSLGEEEEQEDV